MGTTFVRLDVGPAAPGFWADDSMLQVWIYFLAQAAQEMSPRPAWLEGEIQDWLIGASAGGVGCVYYGLMAESYSAEQRAVLAHVAERALALVEAYGVSIPPEVLNSITQTSVVWYKPVDLRYFTDVGSAWLRLMQGQLDATSTVESRLVYGRGAAPKDYRDRGAG
jgi:hypothetical protein